MEIKSSLKVTLLLRSHRGWHCFQVVEPSHSFPLAVRINYLSLLYTLICQKDRGGPQPIFMKYKTYVYVF